MALTHEALKQRLLTALDDLPAEALGEVIAFVDYQLYKLTGGNESEAPGGTCDSEAYGMACGSARTTSWTFAASCGRPSENRADDAMCHGYTRTLLASQRRS